MERSTAAVESTRPDWKILTDEILDYFPAGYTPRPQQIEAIQKINAAFLAGKKVAVLEMPTGGGKSFACKTFADAIRAQDGKTHFLTIQKGLQDQYSRDFPAPDIEVLKGRSNYSCSLASGRHCGDAPCTDQKKGIIPECVAGGDSKGQLGRAVRLELVPEDYACPYWKQLKKCDNNPITLFNFSSFLFQQRIGRFGPRTLMIVDEGHRIEGELMAYVSMELTDHTLSPLGLRVDREIFSKEDLVEWIREKNILVKIETRIGTNPDPDTEGIDDPPPDGDLNAAISRELDRAEREALRKLKGQIENFLSFLDRTDWIIETVGYQSRNRDHRKIVARPLYAKEFAKELLFDRADFILVMSATILDPRMWARNLGLSESEVAVIQTPCDFPVENRPIHLTYAGNMGHKYFDDTKPAFLRTVKAILARHAGQRGIIHSHSFKLLKVIREEISDSRFMFQDQFQGDKKLMIAALEQSPDGVIVAPAMHEGFDLKDDLSRFQIICKVPWPDLTDKVVAERLARRDGYYEWLTALKLAQSYGRSIRSKTDWAYTYIIDSGFDGFLSRNGRLIPQWVSRAFQKYAPREIRQNGT